MISHFKDGPLYLHAAGWTQGESYEAAVNTGDNWRLHASTLDFHGEAGVQLKRVACVEPLLKPLPRSVTKASGIARATWAAKSTVFAALLAKGLIGTVNAQPDKSGDRVGIGIVSSSSIVPIFWQFESVGVADDWGKTDTMLLPASIPSAVGTASSTVTDSHATAITFSDGALGMVSAIEHAYLGFVHDRADYFLIIGAEEASVPIMTSMTSMGVQRPIVDGAAGFVLCRERLSEGDWRIDFVAVEAADRKAELPQEWTHALRFQVQLADPYVSYTSTLLPQAIVQAISTDAQAVVVEFSLRGRATARIGLTRRRTAI